MTTIVPLDCYPFFRSVYQLSTLGGTGVDVFFVLSFYTLWHTYSMRRTSAETPGGSADPESFSTFAGKFLLRRLFRIQPLFYLALLCSWLLALAGLAPVPLSHFSAGNVITHIFMIHGYFSAFANDMLGVEWSLTTEWTFYGVAPFVFLLLWSQRRGVGIGLLTAGSTLVALLSVYEWHAPSYSPLIHLNGFFVAGLLLCWNPGRVIRISISVLLLVLMIVLWQAQGPRTVLWRIRNPPIFFSCLYSLLILDAVDRSASEGAAAAAEGSILSRACQSIASFFSTYVYSTEFLQHVGKVSYSLYLIHIFVVVWLRGIVGPVLFGKAPDTAGSMEAACRPAFVPGNWLSAFPQLLGAIYLLLFVVSLRGCVWIADWTMQVLEQPCIDLGKRTIDRIYGCQDATQRSGQGRAGAELAAGPVTLAVAEQLEEDHAALLLPSSMDDGANDAENPAPSAQ